MNRYSQQFDVLVIGAGPAGIAAAVSAAQCGIRVGIVDDNPRAGGQIWRGESEKGSNLQAARWRDRLQSSSVATLFGKRVFHQPEPGTLLAEDADVLCELKYEKLILATGARERFLPFPGWTLPNVMGAGGLQAMVKSGLPIDGKRVVIAGTGPLLLAVAAYLRKHGAIIPIICEQVSWSHLVRFGVSLLSEPGKILQGLQLRRELGAIPFATNSWPVAAHGNQVLEHVTIVRDGKQQDIGCDYLACGFHLVPNTELPVLLGCTVREGFVLVDEFQQTSMPSIYCAGEPTSIGGVDLSIVEGEIAGFAASDHASDARKRFSRREKHRRFARNLDRAFRLRPELRNLPSPETLVCRCEDVSFSR